LLNAIHVQGFACKCTCTNHQLVVGFREVSHHLSGGNSIDREAIDQRAGHLIGDNFKLRTCHSTASQGVFQHRQRYAEAASFGSQVCHVSDRDTTVFRHHKRLSFSGEVGHF
jgi:hypothetical protein